MTAALEKTNGHKVDVEALYRERRDRLAGAARRAGGDEDHVQDAFVRLIEDPERVRTSPEAYLTTETRMGPRRERAARRDTPVGEHIDRTVDEQPEGNGLPCMGDPAVAAKVNAALDTLPPADARAVRLHLLDGQPVSAVAKTLSVSGTTVYAMVNRSLKRLAALGVNLDEDELLGEPELVAAAPGREGAVPMADLVATLDGEFPGAWVSPKTSEETLRRVHGRCSTVRAVKAQKAHNATLTKPRSASRGRATKSPTRAKPPGVARMSDADLLEQCRALAATLGGPLTQTRVQTTFGTGADRARRMLELLAIGAPVPVVAPAAPASATVAEVWLMGATPPISCLLVRSDETTEPATLAAVSMLGAQREITGRLIGDGYRPDGPWVNVDPAAPEAMRKFQQGESR